MTRPIHEIATDNQIEAAVSTFDTSGWVKAYDNSGELMGAWLWSDIDPFTQGYVEALFAGLEAQDGSPTLRTKATGKIGSGLSRYVGFSDLAPEALALILRDCAAHPNAQPHKHPGDPARQQRSGRNFWTDRQDGSWSPIWPPLTPYLRDDGKIDLKETT